MALSNSARSAGAMPRLAVILAVAHSTPLAIAADPFADRIAPFVTTYCVECHNAKTAEAELNLARYSSAAMVGEDFRQWEHVITFLEREEMPPATAKQPAPELRASILKDLRSVLDSEGRKVASDPGLVLPRRLSNAEYDHTVRDLTGVDIRPTRTFPVDPAAGEGFSNTGEALAMSPGLFAKLYAAAQHVADHALLTTSGIEFAPHPVETFADRAKFYEQAILKFYAAHAIDLEKALTACWEHRHRPRNQNDATIDALARERGLSPKYLRSLDELLNGDPAADACYVGWLRQRWNALPAPPDAASPTVSSESQAAIRRLADDIQTLSRAIAPKETEAIVANAGNGPIDHLARRRRTAAERNTFDAKRLLTDPGHPLSRDIEASGTAFCRLFPNRFYFVDDTRGLSAGFHLIEGFFRDDRPLCELVLNDDENRELDRLWTELEFVTGITEKMLRGFVFFERSERNFLKHADFDPFKEEDPKLVEAETLARFEQVYLKRSNVKAPIEELGSHPIHVFFEQVREGLANRRERFRAAEPIYLRDLKDFARRAYRRPLSAAEVDDLTAFYREYAGNAEFGVEQAARASLVRILMSPYFGCRIDPAPNGDTVAPLPDLALASRLSYFLWSSTPDEELLALAEAGRLRDEATLLAQTRRMLKDAKVAGFAGEFFGQWLGYRDFLQQESVDRVAFKDFDEPLKQAMFEEPTRLAAHLIQNDFPITDLLDTDRTFVDRRLARHYGLPFVGKEGDWTAVDGLRAQGRGGLLGMAVFLTKNSQPQRTSPVKRGFWVVHKVLGEHIPAPPADVVALPAKETNTNGKTIRQLLALHVDDAKCARCHVRFDSVGLAMEGFDPIGRRRTKDLAGRPVDDVVRLADGTDARGVPEFAGHLAKTRRDDYIRTFCRKLLGYALGRSLQLSDDALLEEMRIALEKNGDRFVPVFETVVRSPQFRHQRCRDFSIAKFRARGG